MRKLIALMLLIAGIAQAQYSQEYLESWTGTPLNPYEVMLMPFLEPIKVLDGDSIKPVRCCVGFLEVDKNMGPYILTEEMLAAVRAYDPSWTFIGTELTLREFALSVEDCDTNTVMVSLSTNYKPRAGAPSRQNYTTAEEVARWIYFTSQFGYTNVLTAAQKEARMKEVR